MNAPSDLAQVEDETGRPTTIRSYDVDAAGLRLWTDRGLITLEPRSARTIRIRYTLEPEWRPKPSLTLAPAAADAPATAFRIEDRPDALADPLLAFWDELAKAT